MLVSEDLSIGFRAERVPGIKPSFLSRWEWIRSSAPWACWKNFLILLRFFSIGCGLVRADLFPTASSWEMAKNSTESMRPSGVRSVRDGLYLIVY